MPRMLAVGFAALFLTTAPLAYAQTSSTTQSEFPSESDLKVFTDLRIEIVKGALQLKPEQTKLWPSVEEAIRGRAMVRHARLAKAAAMRNAEGEAKPIEIMIQRADSLTQRGAALKKLADAWQPLYESLDERQKLRLGVLVVYGLRVMMNSSDDDDDED